MKELQVGYVEGSGQQVTINTETGEIVEGVLQNGTLQLQRGLRVQVENGRATGPA